MGQASALERKNPPCGGSPRPHRPPRSPGPPLSSLFESWSLWFPYLETRYANSYLCVNGVAPSGHLAVLDGEFSPGTFFSSKSSPPVI